MLSPKKIKHRKWTKELGTPRFSDVPLCGTAFQHGKTQVFPTPFLFCHFLNYQLKY